MPDLSGLPFTARCPPWGFNCAVPRSQPGAECPAAPLPPPLPLQQAARGRGGCGAFAVGLQLPAPALQPDLPPPPRERPRERWVAPQNIPKVAPQNMGTTLGWDWRHRSSIRLSRMRGIVEGVFWGRGCLLSVNTLGLSRRYFGVSCACLEHFRAEQGMHHPIPTPLSPLTGRLSLSEVQLTSARPGPGTRAGWVEECTCPMGYTGQFCQSCAPGFKREIPFGGPFVSCVPCTCNQHGDCHPLTGVHPPAPPLTCCSVRG